MDKENLKLLIQAHRAQERAISYIIDDMIGEWHDSNENNEIYETLGWTHDQYAYWVETGELPEYE